MTINTNSLNTRITSDSAGNLTELELLQLSAAAGTLENNKVYSVAELANLPAAADNIGRFVFVDSIQTYRYSDGINWIRDYDSNIEYSAGRTIAWAWGSGAAGRLGDNTCIDKNSPVSVVGGFTDWCQISAGSSHTSAIRTNGTLWAWGNNICGVFGNNSGTNSSSPVSAGVGFTDWCQVSGGFFRSIAAVRADGTLWAWGRGTYGQTGNNCTADRFSPMSVAGGFTDWCQVSVGSRADAAVRTNGTLWSWGSGFLGSAASTKSSPVIVSGGFTDWCQVSVGYCHTSAVRTNGTLWSWGNNNYGRLGNNNQFVQTSPVSVVGGFTDWCQASSGYNHTTAIRSNGTLWSWGRNNFGQLGDNTCVDKSSPISAVGGFTDWCQVSTKFHTAAIRTNGTLWTWGRNNYGGPLGDNTCVNKSSPVSVVGGFTSWCQVTVGGVHTAALALIPCRGF